MAVFHSMASILCCTLIAVMGLLWYGTGRQPLAAVYAFVKSLATSPKYLAFFAAMLAILLLNKYELKLEAFFPVRYNLTSALSGWEGSWQGRLQSLLHSDALTLFCAFFYLVMFQAVMIASVGIYTFEKNFKLYYAFCVALLLNYLIAVPFFLFVPVDEAWFVSPHIQFLMLDAFPSFETQYRHLSGLDNCFPSLHTSISVTMALLAARSGNRRWAVFAGINAAVILFSIFYLGIHWFTDMIAGLCLASVSAAVGLKVGDWADRRQASLGADQSKRSRKLLRAASRANALEKG
ncbi:phosphatase PAP2 family protein [Cohnella lubricantis]|uniref:Inositol phosphorylceramide synthase n=1 Tax=Cohnella lubricantis TaxID=2163172 RepID=A0A841TEI3_9BACL|nr:phosphatase PAP2 family protein [Cohnella lubricantis]MBB6677640.1 inositol phosphorylceramide synthase [Cohnella lubricantis]MBP2116472.1 membrane-associated phospholipid phosphatase [Cohnella lubricantis]